MNGLIFCLVASIIFGAVVCGNWLLLRVRPTDRSAIETFAEQRGLRITSLTRSRKLSRYWYPYEAIAEDSEGNCGDIHVAFDRSLGSEQIIILEPRGLALTPPGGSVSLSQLDTTRQGWTWDEQLVLVVVGAGMSGFVFCGILHGYLSSPKRPVFPEPALGYTHLFEVKHGYVYGTFFEYLAVTYGVWTTWGVGAVCGALLMSKLKPRIYPRYPWQIFAAAAISMMLYCAIWQLCNYAARS